MEIPTLYKKRKINDKINNNRYAILYYTIYITIVTKKIRKKYCCD